MPIHQLVLGGGGAGGGVLGGLLGAIPGGSAVASLIGAVTAPVAGAAAILADPLGAVEAVAGGPIALAGQLVGLDQIGVPASRNGVVDSTGFGGGNGRTATRTIVQTMDLVTGNIIRVKTMPGSPRLMNSDVAAARKVIKSVGKLHNQMPRRKTKESDTTKLKNSLMQAALARATKGDC